MILLIKITSSESCADFRWMEINGLPFRQVVYYERL